MSATQSTVISMRLPAESGKRLKRMASRHGWTASDASARLVEEGLRRSEFAFIDFRDSPAGRQTYIQGSTLAVWEVMLLVRSYKGDLAAVAAHLRWPQAKVQGPELGGLWQHALQCCEVHCFALSQRVVDLSRKGVPVVDRSLHSGLRPAKMCGNRGEIPFIAADEQHDLPHREGAALDVCLAAGGGIAKIDEGKFGAAPTLLDQARAGVAGGPAMPARHTLQALPALRGQAHADDGGLGCGHCCNSCKDCNIRLDAQRKPHVSRGEARV